MSTPSDGWPWMQGCSEAIAKTPIPPVHDLDDRPALCDLFEQHRTLIDQVTTEVSQDPLYNPHKHDDLWILRFVLSHKNAKAAIKAAQSTLAFRHAYRLDEHDIRHYRVGSAAHFPVPAVQRYLACCRNDDTFQIVIPNSKLGLVGFFDFAGINQQSLVQNLSDEDWATAVVYVAEWSHQWVDYLSRTTGRLTASIRLIDVGNFSLKMMSSDFPKRDGKAMKVTEDAYPQLLKTLYVCNSPFFIQALYRMVRPFFPKRIVEKTDFLSPVKNERDRNRLLKYISLEHLPTRYGGKNDVWPLNFAVPG